MSLFIGNRGVRLTEERKRLKKDQPEFAALTDVGVQAYLRYEKEDGNEKLRELKANQLAALGNAGVDIWYILTGKRVLPEDMDKQQQQVLDLFAATSDADGLLKLMQSYVNLHSK